MPRLDVNDMAIQNDSKQLLKNTSIYALGDIIPKLLSFLVFPFLTTYLVPEDYGIINYVNTLNVFLTIVGALCLNTYYLVHYYRQDSEVERQRLLGNLSLFTILLNVGIVVVLCLLGCVFPRLFSDKIPFFPYIFIGLLTNLFSIIIIYPSAFYRVKENPLPLTLLNVFRGVLTTICTVVLVACFGFTSFGVLLSNLIITSIFSLIFVAMTWKDTIWNLNRKQLKTALAFSVPLIPGSIASYMVTMSDRFFIERYLDLNQLGIYSTAVSLAMALNVITYGAYKAFEPYIFRIYGHDGFEGKFNKIRDYFLTIILFVGAGLSLFAQDFFRVFANERYQTVYIYVPLVVCSIVISSLTLLYATLLAAQGKTKLSSMFTMTGGSISVLINATFMPMIGLWAACIAANLSFLFVLVMSVAYGKLYGRLVKSIMVMLITAAIVVISVYVLPLGNITISILVRFIALLLIMRLVLSIQQIKVADLMKKFKN